MLTQAPRGTRDIYGRESARWQALEKKIRGICENFGISEIRTPMFEHTELFARGVGETTDIVQKEMYTFDIKGRSLTLRPEGTANTARAYIEHGMSSLPQPVKLYYISPTFRYEKAEAGRQRQFHQFGVELLGSYNPAQDAEAISVAHALISAFGLKNVELRINSLGGNQCRAKYNEILKDYIMKNADMLCPLCRERAEKNPLRVLDCKEEACTRLMENAPGILSCLDKECLEHFESVKRYLDAMGIKYTVDEKIVRGLDYYTRTVFEFVTTSIGAQGTVCGGGRYDNLLEECGGAPTGAVGFGLGMERLLMLMAAEGEAEGAQPERDIYIGSIGEAGTAKAQELAFSLRGIGIRADADTVGRSVKAQMKYANKIGSKFSMIIGDDEIKNDAAVLKNMENGEKFEIILSELGKKLLELI